MFKVETRAGGDGWRQYSVPDVFSTAVTHARQACREAARGVEIRTLGDRPEARVVDRASGAVQYHCRWDIDSAKPTKVV